MLCTFTLYFFLFARKHKLKNLSGKELSPVDAATLLQLPSLPNFSGVGLVLEYYNDRDSWKINKEQKSCFQVIQSRSFAPCASSSCPKLCVTRLCTLLVVLSDLW